MTIANDIIYLSLRNSGVNAIRQGPGTQDVLAILNAWINEQNLERAVKVNRVPVPAFPDLTTDVPFWSPYEHVLLTVMAVRLRQGYSLPPIALDVKLGAMAGEGFNAINLQQTPVPPVGADSGNAFGIIFLALRMAGRVNDQQGMDEGSQDVADGYILLAEMLEEWQHERPV